MIVTALILCTIATIQYFASMRSRSVSEKVTFGVSWSIAVTACFLRIIGDRGLDITTLFEPNLGRFMHAVYEQWLR